MLNINKMLRKNDFTDLLNSTQEQRRQSGGNFYLYSQLIDYIYFESVREVIRYTFKNDSAIMNDLHERTQEKKLQNASIHLNGSDNKYEIILP